MLRWWLVSFAVWTAIYVLAVAAYQVNGPAFPAWQVLLNWLPGFAVPAALSPLVLIPAARWPRRWLLHAALSAVFACVFGALHSVVVCIFWPHASLWRHILKMLPADFTRGVITYWIVLAAAYALDRVRAAELETLRAQLNPHFLFNTLNTISVLMREDTDAAHRLLIRLADMLRSVLGNDSEIKLREELALLENYLEIERARFGDRLRVETSIDPAAMDADVPSLILQPLVENAIRHGIARIAGAGTVSISATRNDDRLVIYIANDGDGWSDDRQGVGLRNTRARLEKLYGARHRLQFDSTADRVTVRMEIPCPSAL